MAAALAGPYLVLVLLGCGLVELAWRHPMRSDGLLALVAWPAAAVGGVGGLGALAWVAFKVGALSYGGGFVIVPLMQHDAVHTYHWMSSAQFLNAVALGQVTPGPVVATVAAVGYAAHGIGGGLLAAVIAFTPSFAFVLFGGGRFDRLRGDPRAQAFLDGAGPAAIGAILGASIPLAARCARPGRRCCWRWRRWRCWSCGAASWRRWWPRACSARSWHWPAGRSRTELSGRCPPGRDRRSSAPAGSRSAGWCSAS